VHGFSPIYAHRPPSLPTPADRIAYPGRRAFRIRGSPPRPLISGRLRAEPRSDLAVRPDRSFRPRRRAHGNILIAECRRPVSEPGGHPHRLLALLRGYSPAAVLMPSRPSTVDSSSGTRIVPPSPGGTDSDRRRGSCGRWRISAWNGLIGRSRQRDAGIDDAPASREGARSEPTRRNRVDLDIRGRQEPRQDLGRAGAGSSSAGAGAR
jgi:hypothetical protein